MSTCGLFPDQTVTGSDPDGNALTYSLTDDAGGRFAVNAATGAVTTTGPLDYEAGHGYSVTVRATDTGGLFTDKAVDDSSYVLLPEPVKRHARDTRLADPRRIELGAERDDKQSREAGDALDRPA